MIVRTVKRGYIMRYNPDEFFEQVLYIVPKGAELFDSDAIPYYIDDGDGTPLREIYSHYAPHDKDVYQTQEPYEDTIKEMEEYMRQRKREMLERQAKEDKQKTKESMLRKIQASMNKIHRK